MPASATKKEPTVKYMVEAYVLYRNNTWKFRHIEISKGLYAADADTLDHELFDKIYASDICSVKVRSRYIVESK